jgi:hypothetical protein
MYLTELPELVGFWPSEQKRKLVEKTYRTISDNGHPIAKALFKLSSINEVRIIEKLS